MRVDLGRQVKARPGDIIWIRAKLGKNNKHARLSVWSRTVGFEFAPHIQLEAMGVTKDGKPEMVPPMRLELNEISPTKELSFIADEELEFCVKQEVDVAADPKAKIKIGSYKYRTYRILRRINKFIKSLISFRAKGSVSNESAT